MGNFVGCHPSDVEWVFAILFSGRNSIVIDRLSSGLVYNCNVLCLKMVLGTTSCSLYAFIYSVWWRDMLVALLFECRYSTLAPIFDDNFLKMSICWRILVTLFGAFKISNLPTIFCLRKVIFFLFLSKGNFASFPLVLDRFRLLLLKRGP